MSTTDKPVIASTLFRVEPLPPPPPPPCKLYGVVAFYQSGGQAFWSFSPAGGHEFTSQEEATRYARQLSDRWKHRRVFVIEFAEEGKEE